MEKDIDKISKNADTDIVIRVDDFGGRRGVTIREFVKGERYTGFTKAGTRIPAEQFKIFKAAINSIDEKDLMSDLPEPSLNNTQKVSFGQNAKVKGSPGANKSVNKFSGKSEEEEFI